ncbi:hypothetical protein BH11PLA2_BH11PLA2_11670 [soil metagenome]
MANVVEAVKAFFEGHADLGSTGIVAVSGGADSVALLRVLMELDRFKLVVAHMNYQLRGDESDGDEEFVRELALSHKLEFQTKRVTIPAGENLEDAARKLRYGWFTELATQYNAQWIATGHTADDQAETVLHRIIRGTGLHGLQGIPVSRSLTDECNLVRPLLNVARSDVIHYFDSLQQTFRHDSTNDQPRFTRNRIRHEVMPVLKTMNSDVAAALSRLAEQSRETCLYLFSAADKLRIHAEQPAAGSTIILKMSVLRNEVHIVVRELFRLIWEREDWPMSDMTFDHWQNLANMVEGDYPGGIRLKRVGTVVQLGPRS